MKKSFKVMLIGLFLASMVVVSSAAMFEDLTVTQLRVKNIKKLGSNTSITFDDPVIFSDGLSVADGIVNIEAEIDCTGDMTLDPAGDDLIVDATVDATAYTSDAGSGLDVKSAGALPIGAVTATSLNLSKTLIMTTVKGTLNVDEAVTLDTTLDVTGTSELHGNVTCSTNLVVEPGGELTLDSKYAVVGPDASNGMMMQMGGGANVTNGATVTFPVEFGSAPIVVISYNTAAVTGTNCYPSSTASATFVVNGEVGKVCNWAAYGIRP